MKQSKESVLGYPYVFDPAWHLLNSQAGRVNNIDYFDKDQSEFFLVCDKVLERKIGKNKKEVAKKAFRDFWNSLKVYETECNLLNGSLKRLFEDGLYREPKSFRDAKERALGAYRDLKVALKRCFKTSELLSLSRKLNLPSNMSASLFNHLITNSKKIDRMPKVFISGFDLGRPKVLLTSNATRDELDAVLLAIKGRRQLLLPLKGKKMRPYIYKHSDGFDYVAVDLFHECISAIRRMMPQIDRLQSKLPGYGWKLNRKRKNFERDLILKNVRAIDPKKPYFYIDFPGESSPSDATLRKAHQRIKNR